MKLQLTLVAVVTMFLTACGGQVSVYRGTRTSTNLKDGKTFTVNDDADAIYLYPGDDQNTLVLQGLFSTALELQRVGPEAFNIQPVTSNYTTGPTYSTREAITDCTATITATSARFTLHGTQEYVNTTTPDRSTFTVTFDGQRL